MKKLFVLIFLSMLMLGCGGGHGTDGKYRIVTSFYPIYIDAINLATGIKDVEVVNLTPPTTGCLHDYQLTPEDMKTLETALPTCLSSTATAWSLSSTKSPQQTSR